MQFDPVIQAAWCQATANTDFRQQVRALPQDVPLNPILLRVKSLLPYDTDKRVVLFCAFRSRPAVGGSHVNTDCRLWGQNSGYPILSRERSGELCQPDVFFTSVTSFGSPR